MAEHGWDLVEIEVRYVTGDINAWVFRPTTDMAHLPKHESTTIIQQCNPHSGLISWVLIYVAYNAAAVHAIEMLRILLYNTRSRVCLNLFPSDSTSSLIFVSTAYSVMEMRFADARTLPPIFALMSCLQYT